MKDRHKHTTPKQEMCAKASASLSYLDVEVGQVPAHVSMDGAVILTTTDATVPSITRTQKSKTQQDDEYTSVADWRI